jgi:hypothetical protein
MRSCCLAKTSEATSTGIHRELLEAGIAAGYFVRRRQDAGIRAARRDVQAMVQPRGLLVRATAEYQFLYIRVLELFRNERKKTSTVAIRYCIVKDEDGGSHRCQMGRNQVV